MAWPYDARHFVFANGLYVPSASLNEMEDRIVDCYREKTRVILDAFCNETAGVADWTYNVSNVYWNCDVLGDIWFPIHAPAGLRLHDCEVKFRGNGPIAVTIDLLRVDGRFNEPTVAPTAAAIATPHNTAHNGVWATISMTPTSVPTTLAVDEGLYIYLQPGQTGDRCAGVQITYEPITPTP